ncbi:MAG: redoxin domain-containing protein [Proteobacteria bacterium]|nr:redoxin domain-containing protein [Pseudomonadota bacterium]
MQLSHKDKSLILLITTALVVLWIIFSLFSHLFFGNFKNSDSAKIISSPKQDWINLSRPLEQSDLEDRVILLDFWTYSCVSCIEATAEIKKLEERFGNKLTVIGVHSARSASEAKNSALKKAVLKRNIDFPVVNDPELKIWNNFKIKSLPSFALINAMGKLERTYSGLDEMDQLKTDVKKIIEKHKIKISREPLPLMLEKYNTIGNVLSFPTKLEYAARFSYKSRNLPVLFIANSAQNSIVASSLTGEIILKIGSEKEGFVDGDFDSARFNNPLGILFDGNKLYVADSGNHALRVIDFKEEKVSTLIGSGFRGQKIESNTEGKNASLSSPSDLEFFPNKNVIAIANPGSNQILSYDIKANSVSVLAGDLAQTADLASFGGKLYFVDSYDSSLRVVDQKKEVKTLLDKDSGLQHPLGLAVDDTGVYVVDSLNNKIRKFDFASKKLQDFAGSQADLDEPEGIIAVLDRFYVADSNNNRILSINRGSLKAEILDVMPPLRLPKEGFLEYLPNLQTLEKLVVKKDLELAIKIELDDGWKINEQGPSFVNLLGLTSQDKADLVASFDWVSVKEKEMKLPKLSSSKDYLLQGTIYYCEEKENALCYIKSYEQKISAESEGAEEIKIILGGKDGQK